MTTRVLVVTTGWIGDILFSIPLAQKLKEQYNFTTVDYLIDKPQPYLIVKNNQYIDNVYYIQKDNSIAYQKTFVMPVIEDKSIAPTIQYQISCGITNLSTEFDLHVDLKSDLDAKDLIKDKKIITYQGDWNDRFWKITDVECYSKMFDMTHVRPFYKTTNPGNIEYVLELVKKARPDYIYIPISPYSGSENYSTDPRGYSTDIVEYQKKAALIKNSKFFLGAEGGLTNLSSGLGTRTIYTTCHMERMFGKQGVISRCDNIQLGPEKLFPKGNHKAIDPYASPEEVAQTIIDTI